MLRARRHEDQDQALAPDPAMLSWIEAVPVPMIVTRTADRSIVAANRHAQALFGHPPDQWTRITFDQLARPDFRSEIRSKIARAERTAGGVLTWIKEYVRADGTTFLGHLTASAFPGRPDIGCAVITDIDDVDHLSTQTLRSATTDPLTRALRREAFVEAILRNEPEGAPYGLVFIDLDDFKQVNDSYGHLAGDEVLRVVSRRIQQSFRAGDHVARYGGDEFVVFVPTITDEKTLHQRANRMVDRIEAPVRIGDLSIRVSASIGAYWASAGTDVHAAIEAADQAMYRVKRERPGSPVAGRR